MSEVRIGLINPDALSVRNTDYAGIGVFAKSKIKSYTTLERTLAVPLPTEQQSSLFSTVIWEYHFVTSHCLVDEPTDGHLLLGLASICNHSWNANAEVLWLRDDTGVWGTLRSIKDVRQGEEVTIFYTNIEDYVNRGLIHPNTAQYK